MLEFLHFFTPTAYGTLLAKDKETRTINGKDCVLETGINADISIVKGYKADTMGNVIFKILQITSMRLVLSQSRFVSLKLKRL